MAGRNRAVGMHMIRTEPNKSDLDRDRLMFKTARQAWKIE